MSKLWSVSEDLTRLLFSYLDTQQQSRFKKFSFQTFVENPEIFDENPEISVQISLWFNLGQRLDLCLKYRLYEIRLMDKFWFSTSRFQSPAACRNPNVRNPNNDEIQTIACSVSRCLDFGHSVCSVASIGCFIKNIYYIKKTYASKKIPFRFWTFGLK